MFGIITQTIDKISLFLLKTGHTLLNQTLDVTEVNKKN